MRTMQYGTHSVALVGWGFLVPADAQRRREPVKLPEGAGRALVQASCTSCHRLNLIPNSWGFTEEGWKMQFSSMVDLRIYQSPAGSDVRTLLATLNTKPPC